MEKTINVKQSTLTRLKSLKATEFFRSLDKLINYLLSFYEDNSKGKELPKLLLNKQTDKYIKTKDLK